MQNYGQFVTVAAVSYGARRKGRRVGDVIGVIWPYVSVAEIEKLDAKIINLHTDIMALRVPPPENVQDVEEIQVWVVRDRALAQFKREWTAYRGVWNAWKRDHYGEIARTGDGVRQSFDDVRSGYNEYLRRYKAEWQGETEAKPAESDAGKESPIEKGLSTLHLLSLAVIAGVGVYAYKQVKD